MGTGRLRGKDEGRKKRSRGQVGYGCGLLLAEVGDEALNGEFLFISKGDEALNHVFL
jgi:hypothetical protein